MVFFELAALHNHNWPSLFCAWDGLRGVCLVNFGFVSKRGTTGQKDQSTLSTAPRGAICLSNFALQEVQRIHSIGPASDPESRTQLNNMASPSQQPPILGIVSGGHRLSGFEFGPIETSKKLLALQGYFLIQPGNCAFVIGPHYSLQGLHHLRHLSSKQMQQVLKVVFPFASLQIDIGPEQTESIKETF